MTKQDLRSKQDEVKALMLAHAIQGLLSNPEVCSLMAGTLQINPDENAEYAKDIADIATNVVQETLKYSMLFESTPK